VYARRLRRDGTPLGSDFRVNTGLSSGMLAHHVSLCVDGAGWFYVLWHAARSPGQLVRGGAGVFLRIFNPDGLPAAPEMRVSPETRGAMAELSVAPQGNGAAVWCDRGQVWGRRLTRQGPVGTAVRLDDTPAGHVAEFPAVACGKDGGLLVAWADTRTGGRDVYARLLGSDLRPRSAAIRVGDGPVPTAFFRLISVAATSAGYAVLWLAPDGQCGRWFDERGRALGGVTAVLPATSEVATLPQPDGSVLVSNGRSLRVWRPGGLGEEVALLSAPSRPCEVHLAVSRQGIWAAWHDALDMRRLPALDTMKCLHRTQM
jgi:hypothetical protein